MAEVSTGPQFQNIVLGGRAANPGLLKIHPRGFLWKKAGGGKVVDVAKDDVRGISWTKLQKGYQMSIQMKAGSVKFNGFREQDVQSLNSFISTNMGVTPEDKPLAVSGRNWGDVELQGNSLNFLVGGKQAFAVSVADVSQSQVQGKNDVVIEFHIDDTAGANEKDALMEISFHVPNTNTTFVGDEDRPPSQVMSDAIALGADLRTSGEAVAAFSEVTILTPRGRYLVELHYSYMRLIGANDFKIQYTSIVRMFILPRPAQPGGQSNTYVVVTLDPPIRKGQTFYPHIVLQYPSEEITELAPQVTEEQLQTKYKERLELQYKDLSYEVFCKILRGLSEARVSRPGKYRSSQNGYAVRASLKAEEGLLYPLEKSFFFLPKPPTLVTHEEIDYVEFERGGGTSSISSKNFDIIIHLKSEQEYQFRNILRNEYASLHKFISEKGLKILSVDAQETTAVEAALHSDEDGVDPHLVRIARETGVDGDSDEEDEDFVAGKDDEGSPTDDSGGEESDGSEREEEERPAPKKDKKAEPAAPKPAAPKPAKRKSKEKDDDQSKKKKKRQKKDPNAPKRALSGFMFYAQEERENLKRTNPRINFTEMGKLLGERWRELSAEEKEPYERKARADKERYKEQMAGYKGGAADAGPSNEASD